MPNTKAADGLWWQAKNRIDVEIQPTIEQPAYPSPTGGAFCEEPDPSVLWTYTISDNGKTLTLHPVGQDPCGERSAIVDGTWTRDGN